jgi:hypothetical protein
MNNNRLLRVSARRRHLHEKAMIDHVARLCDRKGRSDGKAAHSSMTRTGLTVEGQVRKKWGPHMGGLAIF